MKSNLKSKKSNPTLRHPISDLGIHPVLTDGIRVEKLEERLEPRVPFPHSHDFFQILIITRGSGFHEIDFQKHAVKAASLFLMKPGQVHSWKMNPGTKGFVIEFTADSLSPDSKRTKNPLQESRGCSDCSHIRKASDLQELVDIAVLMRKEFLEEKLDFQFCLQGLLSSLLFKVLRLSSKHERSDNIDSAEKFKSLVDAHFHSQHQVEFYAEKMGMTAKALTMKLSRALKKSARLIIQERSVLEAKRLLSYSKLGIAEIGYQLGFEDPNYFARFFKSKTKMTPAQFRLKSKK